MAVMFDHVIVYIIYETCLMIYRLLMLSGIGLRFWGMVLSIEGCIFLVNISTDY